MRAIQVSKTGGPEVLQLVELPTPTPQAGQVLVKIAAVGVNFIDVYLREGRYPAALPFVDGQEAAGTVEATGAGVTNVRVGDRVAYCGLLGSYAEYQAVPADRVVAIPAGVTERQGAAAMLQGMTAHYLSHDAYRLQPGDTALIHAAAGGVGLLLVQMAKARGARVIATAGNDEKAALARQAGADETIVYTRQDFEAETKRLTDGVGVQVIYDGVGKATFDKDLEVLRPRGMLVLFGMASGPVPPFDLGRLAQKGSLFITRPTLIHYVLATAELQTRAAAVLGEIAAGRLNLRISKEYLLAEAAKAHRDLEARATTGKLLLIPRGEPRV